MDPLHWIDIGDTHLGSKYAVTPPGGFTVDGGGRMPPNPVQRLINECWEEFWEIANKVSGGNYIFSHKGDIVEGHHHRSKEAISFNFKDQRDNAIRLLKPHTDKAVRSIFVRGTPAHAGEESEHEEEIARACGADPDYAGRYCWPLAKVRWHDLWVNVAHHISISGVSASQASAPQAELVELQRTAQRVGIESPDIVTRGHRHSATGVWEAGPKGTVHSITTPGWQARYGYAMKHRGGRTTELYVGGVIWEYHKFWGATPHLVGWFILENDGDPSIVRSVK